MMIPKLKATSTFQVESGTDEDHLKEVEEFALNSVSGILSLK